MPYIGRELSCSRENPRDEIPPTGTSRWFDIMAFIVTFPGAFVKKKLRCTYSLCHRDRGKCKIQPELNQID